MPESKPEVGPEQKQKLRTESYDQSKSQKLEPESEPQAITRVRAKSLKRARAKSQKLEPESEPKAITRAKVKSLKKARAKARVGVRGKVTSK